MANILLYNESLINLAKGLRIDRDQKDFLISEIPTLDRKQRISLFKMLTQVYLLDLEEKEAIERIRKFRQE